MGAFVVVGAFVGVGGHAEVERLILEGNIAAACHECEHHCPGIFAAAGPNRGVYFGLLCQQFIEYIRSGCDKEALTLAQRELAEFGYEDAANLAKLTVRIPRPRQQRRVHPY